MPYCSNCRTFIPDGVDTCPNCGTKDSRYTSAPPPTQSKSQGQQNIPKAKKSFVELIKKIFRRIIRNRSYKFFIGIHWDI